MKNFQSTRAYKSVRAFVNGEAGAGTAFGLFIFVSIAMCLGLALDFTNTWRNRTYLSASVDIAAHAGAVAIANGATTAEAIAEIEEIVEFNMPTSLFGNVLNATTDVTFASYDPDDGGFDSFSPADPNSVIVEVYRNKNRNNPVATYLMNFLGFDAFNVEAISAAVYDASLACNHSDGIYGKGQVTLTSQTDVGAGFCIHSEDFVWLPQQNTFQPGAYVTMPDLDDCKTKCVDSANPGIVAGEAHMVFGDFGDKITTTYAAFEGDIGSSGTKYDFFHDDPLDASDPEITLGDTTELISVAGLHTIPSLGDVIELTNTEIMSMEELPSGLVYVVDCSDNGNGPKTRIEFSDSSVKMDGSVLLSDCSYEFEDGASIESSVIITTRDASNAVISSGSDVTIGDPHLTCDHTGRSYIMSASKVSVPAEFVLSNVTLVVDDDVHIASATSSGVISYGFAIYATGTIKVAAQHTFRSCGAPPSDIAPEANVLRLVVPPASMI